MSLLVAALVLTGCSQTQVSNQTTEVYFVGDTAAGLRIFSEIREFPTSGGDWASELVGDLISGQLQPLDSDYVNLWDRSNRFLSLKVEGPLATLDLSLGKLNVGSEGEARAIDQLVWTITGIFPAVEQVRFLVDGKTIESFAGHVDTTAAFQRGNEYETLSAIQIESLNEGAELENPVKVEGSACTFEANVAWTLLRGEEVIAEGSTTAQEACPSRSTWSVELGDLEAGEYLFVAFEVSAKDGSVVSKDDKRFTVNLELAARNKLVGT